MKVLLIGDYPPPHGGVAVHVKQLHDFLRRGGVATRVLDIGKGGRPAPEVLPVHTPGAYVRALAHHAAEGFTFHLHTSGNNLKAYAVAALAAPPIRRSGVRVISLH